MASYLPTTALMASEFRRTVTHPWGLRALGSCVVFATFFFIRDSIPRSAFLGMGASITLAWVYGRSWLDARARFRKAWSRYRGPIELTIADDRIEVKHEFGGSVLLRVGVEAVLESPDAFVLSAAGNPSFFSVPKAPLSPEESALLRSWTVRPATPSAS